MSLFPFPELHEMTGYMENKNVIWVCPECGRKVNANPYVVIVEGNQSVTHYGNMGGVRKFRLTAQQNVERMGKQSG